MQPGSFSLCLSLSLSMSLSLSLSSSTSLSTSVSFVLSSTFPSPRSTEQRAVLAGQQQTPAPPSRCTRCQGRPTSYALPAQVQLEPLSCLLAAPRLELAAKGVTRALARLLAARDMEALVQVQGGVGCGALGRCAGAWPAGGDGGGGPALRPGRVRAGCVHGQTTRPPAPLPGPASGTVKCSGL